MKYKITLPVKQFITIEMESDSEEREDILDELYYIMDDIDITKTNIVNDEKYYFRNVTLQDIFIEKIQ